MPTFRPSEMEGAASERGALVGRGEELATIYRLLDALSAGHAGFAEFVGEPGIGKTTLLFVLAARASERGWLVLRGRASQFELETPFDPFVDALDDYLASLNPRWLQSLGDEQLAELAAAFPALRAAAVEHAEITGEERYRIHRAVRELLRTIATLKPLVLILDDAHWSDEASLELLRHLMRRPPAGPVLVAIAYRTGTMPDSWQRVADAAAREGDLTRAAVGPLGVDDAELMLKVRIPDAETRARVFEAAGGNPFFIRQLAEAPQVVARANAAVRGPRGVPQAVIEAINEEVASLGAETREALRAAAVAGDPFDPAFAAAAAGIAEVDLLPHLDALSRCGLIRAGDSPRRFQFRHPLVWRGVDEGSPAGWRLEAHRRLAEHMASRGASATMRAPHVEAAGQPGDLEAVAVLREAAQASLAQAPASAAHWLAAALRLLPDDPAATSQRSALLVPLATALGSIGRLQECRDRLRELFALIPPDAAAARVEAVVAWATMESLLRNHPDATRLLTRELGALPDPQSREAGRILLALASLHVFDSDREAAREWTRRARGLAARNGWRSIEGAATATLALHEMRFANGIEARRLLDRATELIDATEPRVATAEDIDPPFWLSMAEMYFERFTDSLRHGDRVLKLARDAGQGRWLPQMAAARGFSLWFLGRVDAASATLEAGLEMAELTANRQFEAVLHCLGAVLLTSSGRLREAAAAGQRAMDLAGPPAETPDEIALFALECAAIPTLESGDPLTARRLLEAAMDDRGVSRVEVMWQFIGLDALVETELRLGHIDAAASHARRSVELAERLGLEMRRSVARRGLASVELARGKATDAVTTAREASEHAGRAGARIERGRSLTVAGRALAAAGDVDRAVDELQRAHDLLDKCGASHYRDQAARELRRLGVRIARPGRRGTAETGPAALSARERAIAELVSAGKTNKQIAASLYLSPKTVDKHLGNVFRKLGVTKRAAVGAKLREPA